VLGEETESGYEVFSQAHGDRHAVAHFLRWHAEGARNPGVLPAGVLKGTGSKTKQPNSLLRWRI